MSEEKKQPEETAQREGELSVSRESGPQLITPGVIAARLGEPLHRVVYVLATRPHIRPAARAGRLRLYQNQDIARVRYELNLIDARRCPRPEQLREE
jgi:hypothetical protein